MKIVDLSGKYNKIWDDFVINSKNAWFWHTTDWFSFTCILNHSKKTKDISFFLEEKGEVLAIVPLTLEDCEGSDGGDREFSFAGGAVPAAVVKDDLSAKAKRTVFELITQEIDKRAGIFDVKRASFRAVPISCGFLEKLSINEYLQYGYIDISLNTQIIDLSKDTAALYEDLRKNHKRNIEAGKEFDVKVFFGENVTRDIFIAYKEMHHKAAGRKTRPDTTFEMMYDWLVKKQAFLFAVIHKDSFIGFEYYSVFKDNVYGFSAANDPDFEHLPVRHILEWQAILWMKQQGYKYYEIGMQHYGILPYDFPDKKNIDISHFKRGFGGFAVPQYIAEKYYSKEYYKKNENERNSKFLEMYDFEGSVEIEKSLSKCGQPKKTFIVDQEGREISDEELISIADMVLSQVTDAQEALNQNNRSVNYFIGRMKWKVREMGGKFDYPRAEAIMHSKLGSLEGKCEK